MAAASLLRSFARKSPAVALSQRRLGGVRLCHWERPSVDCYAMLGIGRSASKSEIKKAYYAKSMELHPDSMEGAESIFGSGYCDMVQVNLCYDALMKDELRAEYNADNSWRWPAPAEPDFDEDLDWTYRSPSDAHLGSEYAHAESDDFFDGVSVE